MSIRKKTRTKGLWETSGGFYHARLWRNGKAKWVPLGKDYEAAKRKFFALKGGDPIPSRVNLTDAAADWLKLAVATRRNKKGQELARTWVDHYLTKYFTGLLGAIDGDSIRAYRLWLEKKNLSANTVTRILSDLRALLNWCEETGRIERSPFPRRVMPRIPETAPQGFTDDERTILMTLPEPHGFMLRFLLGTGLRYAEACHAQTSHVRDGVLEVQKGKWGKVRRVPLPEALAEEVRNRVGRMVPYSPVNTGSFNRTIRRLSGIRHFHVHRTRHDFCIQWLVGDGSLAALQALTGHAHISTTMRYARINEDLVKRETERVFRAREGA